MRRELLKRACFGLLGACALNLMTTHEVWAGIEAEGIDANEDSGTQSGPFPLPAGARLESDLAYGGDPRQQLDVYHPAAADHAPIIVMVHGGGWTRGKKNLWGVVKNKVTHWVGKGYILVAVNYRMSPQADPVAQADDVATALAFVQSHLSSWGGDANSLILMGHSSGAHLVALLSADPQITSRKGVRPWRATVALDSAAMNVEQLMRRRHLGLYDRVFGSDPVYWREASPTLRLAGAPVAPLLLVCSSRRMDSCPQAQGLAMRVAQFGGRAQVLPVDLTHPEINAELGTPGTYTAGVDAFLKSVGLP